jgi:hypothetical protein
MNSLAGSGENSSTSTARAAQQADRWHPQRAAVADVSGDAGCSDPVLLEAAGQVIEL